MPSEHIPGSSKSYEFQGKERRGKERNFISVSSHSSAGALIGDTVNSKKPKIFLYYFLK